MIAIPAGPGRPGRSPERVGHRRVLFTLALLGAAVAACADAEPGSDETRARAPTPKVLLIGIDGVRADVLAEVPTPSLDALAAEGVLVGDVRTTTPSVSGPAWSSMLTGVWPDKHGVLDNEFVGKRYEAYPDFLTRIERVRPDLETVAIADWLPLVRAEEGLATVSDEVDVKHVMDGYELGWAEADERSTELAVEALTYGDPDALFVYLGNPDETSHEHGSIGAEYRAALAGADANVGRIVGALRARDSYDDEDWLILVSTDHGRRADGGHGGDSPEEMKIFVLLHGAVARDASRPEPVGIVDVAPTALAHLGITAPAEWDLDGRSLTAR